MCSFNTTHQHILVAQKTICILGCSKRILASRVREGILPLCITFKRTYLECYIQLWSSPQKRDLLEQVQKKAMKMITSNSSPLEDRELGLLSNKKRRLKRDLIAPSRT